MPSKSHLKWRQDLPAAVIQSRNTSRGLFQPTNLTYSLGPKIPVLQALGMPFLSEQLTTASILFGFYPTALLFPACIYWP